MNAEQKTYRKNYYTSDDSGKLYIIALLAPLAILFIWNMVGGAICAMANLSVKNLESYLWFAIPYSILGQLTFLLVFVLYNKLSKTAFSAANVKKISVKNTFLCLLIALIALFGLQFFVATFDHLLGLTGFHIQDEIAPIPLNNAGWFVLYLFIYALLPAICEELIFRGVILSGLRRQMGDYAAIALSALMFALMHGSLQQLIYPFILGCIFALVVVRTGSTLASMMIHFSNNALVVLFAYLKTNLGFDPFKFVNSWWYYLLSFGLLIVVALAIYLIDKFYFKHKNQAVEAVQDGQKTRISIFVWIGLIIAVGLLLFATIMNFVTPVPVE